jgi:hypothetical protein
LLYVCQRTIILELTDTTYLRGVSCEIQIDNYQCEKGGERGTGTRVVTRSSLERRCMSGSRTWIVVVELRCQGHCLLVGVPLRAVDLYQSIS